MLVRGAIMNERGQLVENYDRAPYAGQWYALLVVGLILKGARLLERRKSTLN
jgi:hypothetical protein